MGLLMSEILSLGRRASSDNPGGVVTFRIWVIEKSLENLAGDEEQI